MHEPRQRSRRARLPQRNGSSRRGARGLRHTRHWGRRPVHNACGENILKAPVSVVLLLVSAAAVAQGYPSKPITFVIPFAAGGDSDLSGRNVAAHASKYLNNQPIVPVNRTGASGAIGAMAVKNAAPDGYTLLVARIATHAILPALESKLQYRWNEFTMLSLIELNPYMCFVRGDSTIRSAADLVNVIRVNPGKLNFATAGICTSQNMESQ